ncbi:unnamed protein product [Amoebophrya sp. A25]|nr:unnamed protein product [Amoebophrya sp. A25]|eukprot:GSA25T00017500001.1
MKLEISFRNKSRHAVGRDVLLKDLDPKIHSRTLKAAIAAQLELSPRMVTLVKDYGNEMGNYEITDPEESVFIPQRSQTVATRTDPVDSTINTTGPPNAGPLMGQGGFASTDGCIQNSARIGGPYHPQADHEGDSAGQIDGSTAGVSPSSARPKQADGSAPMTGRLNLQTTRQPRVAKPVRPGAKHGRKGLSDNVNLEEESICADLAEDARSVSSKSSSRDPSTTTGSESDVGITNHNAENYSLQKKSKPPLVTGGRDNATVASGGRAGGGGDKGQDGGEQGASPELLAAISILISEYPCAARSINKKYLKTVRARGDGVALDSSSLNSKQQRASTSTHQSTTTTTTNTTTTTTTTTATRGKNSSDSSPATAGGAFSGQKQPLLVPTMSSASAGPGSRGHSKSASLPLGQAAGDQLHHGQSAGDTGKIDLPERGGEPPPATAPSGVLSGNMDDLYHSGPSRPGHDEHDDHVGIGIGGDHDVVPGAWQTAGDRAGADEQQSWVTTSSDEERHKGSSTATSSQQREYFAHIPRMVYVNCYHVKVGEYFNFSGLNSLFDFFGFDNFGAYHVGIEVYGDEWQYGYCEEGHGISRVRPRISRDHIYAESIPIGQTRYSRREVQKMLQSMQIDWLGGEYDLNGKNCVDFARALSARLLYDTDLGGSPLRGAALASGGMSPAAAKEKASRAAAQRADGEAHDPCKATGGEVDLEAGGGQADGTSRGLSPPVADEMMLSDKNNGEVSPLSPSLRMDHGFFFEYGVPASLDMLVKNLPSLGALPVSSRSRSSRSSVAVLPYTAGAANTGNNQSSSRSGART